jgi:transposase InsO family protein
VLGVGAEGRMSLQRQIPFGVEIFSSAWGACFTSNHPQASRKRLITWSTEDVDVKRKRGYNETLEK